MFEIHGNDLYISRGEAVTLNITPYEEDGTVHELDPLEYLELRIMDINSKERVHSIRTLFGSTEFKIGAKDTENLRGAFSYVVRLVFADNSAKTIIGETPTYRPRLYVMEG